MSNLTKGQNLCNVKFTNSISMLGRMIAEYDIPSMGFSNASGMVLKTFNKRRTFSSSVQDNPSRFYNKKTNSIEVRAIERRSNLQHFDIIVEKRLMTKYERFEFFFKISFECPRLLVCVGLCLVVGK